MTVNLEKALIRQNKKVVTPKQLLNIREFDRLATILNENDALQRVGVAGAAIRGREIKQSLQSKSECIAKYDQSRVFHISQIKSICTKYHLRFLESRKFVGSVDPELANKIVNFEIAYNQKLDADSCMIMAPASSFKLEEKPKDPLFFACIATDYYYLVHKWGNDLSIFRRVLPLLSNAVFCGIVFYTFMFSLIVFSFVMCKHYANIDKDLLGITFLIIAIFGVIGTIATIPYQHIEDVRIRFVKKNNWNSEYI